MTLAMQLAIARLGAARQANADDAALWRWVADVMEERRLCWRHQDEGWVIEFDGRMLACRPDFDDAMRAAHQVLEVQPPPGHRW